MDGSRLVDRFRGADASSARRTLCAVAFVCAVVCSPVAAGDKGPAQPTDPLSAQNGSAVPQGTAARPTWSGVRFPDRVYLVNGSHEAPPAKQVEAERAISLLFPQADTITLGIAFVPDPRVPRHRRAFDIAISSITSGMQDANYMIDRFSFPWTYKSTAGNNAKDGDNDGGDGSSSDGTSTQVIDDGKFGLMLFRQDCWRKPGAGCPRSTQRVAAMYLVPETVTFGVAAQTLEHAFACVREQVSDSQSIPALGTNTVVRKCIAEHAAGAESISTPAAAARTAGTKPKVVFLTSGHPDCHRMVLLGPSFSGSIDSIARVLSATEPELEKSPDGKELAGDKKLAAGVCTISMSATAEANRLVVDYGKPLRGAAPSSEPTPIYAAKYYSLAVPDDVKLEALADLADHLGVAAKKMKVADNSGGSKDDSADHPGGEGAQGDQDASNARKGDADQLRGDKKKERGDDAAMALLCEESSFGSGLCEATVSNSDTVRNLNFIKMRFPANIADIRYHRSEAQRQAASDTPVDVSALNGKLHLDEGAENGSEYPDSQQSPLTAASSELKLDAMLAILGKRSPQIIAIAATDVRDRLFLFDLLRAEVPSALLVDMEADVLLAHPDFLHASRGVVMMASHQLHDDLRSVGNGPVRSYATDYEALAIIAISQLMHGEDPLPPLSSPPSTGPLPCVFVAARGGPRRATIWSSEGKAVPVCAAPNNTGWDLYQLQKWGGIVGVLLALLLALWLARRCDSWITNSWAGWAAPVEFAPLPVIAATMVMFSLPQSAKSWQGLRNVLVVCAVLSPLLALHRAASRTFTASALADGKWFFSLRKLARAVRTLPLTIKVTLLPAAIVNVVFIILALCTWIGASLSGHSGTTHYWLRLAMDTSSGLALMPALGITLSAAFFGLFFICVGACRHARNTAIMELVAAKLSLHIVHREFSKALLLGMYIALAFVVAKSLPLALTIFGPFASYATCCAEIALGCQAIMFIAWALQSSRRLHSFAATLDWTVQRTHGALEADKIWKEFWSACPNGPVFLPNTPFSASLQPVIETYRSLNGGETSDLANRILSDAKEQSGQIAGWIKEPCEQPGVGIWAIYRLLVSEVNALRWSVFGALFSCLTLVLVVYAFPAPGADNFLLLGLALMILAGLITAYAVTSLERSKVISRVLCNTSERIEFSWTYFAYLVSPALLLALAVAILEMPGVLVWGNGMMAMLKYIGLFK